MARTVGMVRIIPILIYIMKNNVKIRKCLTMPDIPDTLRVRR